MIPTDPEALLRRSAVAQALTEAGYPTTVASLATKACRGGGPLYVTYGRTPFYRWKDAIAWAAAQMSGPRTSTKKTAVADASAAAA